MLNYSTKQKIFRFGALGFMAFFVIGGSVAYYYGFQMTQDAKRSLADEQQKQAAIEKSKTQENVFVQDVVLPIKPVENDPAVVPDSIPRSENFQLREIVFNGYGNGGSTDGEIKDTPLKVSNVYSEVLVSKDGKEVKLYISWKTNKLAKSNVSYSRSGGADIILSEDGAGYSHSLVIGKFEFDTRYTYSVKASDRWGNVAKSDDFVAFSAKKENNIFTVLSNEFNKMFGWVGTMNK